MTTIDFDPKADAVLDQLCKEKDMSKKAVLRQALSIYQLVNEKRKEGFEMAFVKDGKIEPIVVIGCGDIE
jgi:predicted transcriptional regulator